MKITIKEVTTKRELKQFVKFPNKLYLGNKFYVPPLIYSELKTLSKKDNPSFEFCEAKYWLAYINNKIVGRVAGVINYNYNKKVGENFVRFGWLDFIEDENVLKELIETVESWAIQKNIKTIHGPLGLSEFDASGILIEGFEERSTSFGKFNFPYYSELIEKLGFKKDIDWVEYNIKVPKSIPEKYSRIAMVVKNRYKLHSGRLRKKKDLLKYSDEVFQLLNQEYAGLYAFSELTKTQCEDLKSQFIPLLRLKYVSIILNAENNVVGFGICMPSLSKALQKAKGHLYPLGILRIQNALKYNDTIDTLLIAVHKDYKDKGVNSVIFNDIGNSIINSGITNIESTRELEENFSVQNLWNKFEFRQHKKTRCYVKKLVQPKTELKK
ncbi:MAG: hypothetical protein H6Q12_195 [Bacteroidetes bacterium]|nr:hypothetical protein [Bacteroidota bacterium]